MIDAFMIKMHLRRLRDGIIMTNHFHRAAVTRPVIFNYDHAVRGLFLAPNRARRIANISNLFFSLLFQTFERRAASAFGKARRKPCLEPWQAGQFHFSKPLAEHSSLTGEALHHFTRLRILFQQIVHIGDAGTASFGNTPAARAVY